MTANARLLYGDRLTYDVVIKSKTTNECNAYPIGYQKGDGAPSARLRTGDTAKVLAVQSTLMCSTHFVDLNFPDSAIRELSEKLRLKLGELMSTH